MANTMRCLSKVGHLRAEIQYGAIRSKAFSSLLEIRRIIFFHGIEEFERLDWRNHVYEGACLYFTIKQFDPADDFAKCVRVGCCFFEVGLLKR